MAHLRDRWLVRLTAARLAMALAVLIIPALVPMPGTDQAQPVAAFLPLAVAVPAGLSLRERLAWIGTGSAAVRLGLLRMATSLVADVVVFAACALVVALVPTPGASLPATVSCAAAVEGVAYLAAVGSARFAWLVAATLGSIALFGLPPHGIPLVFSLPLWVGATVFLLGFAAYALSSVRAVVNSDSTG